ncbi:Ubiquitin carboxyl-terminal hydrolase 10, partial [Microtus ochrogaster]
QEHQRIEFGVDEVIKPSNGLPRAPSYSISSTLNPQAPEFILGCTTSKKTPDGIDKDENYSSVDQYPDSALTLENSSNVEGEALENDGSTGGLGQRERKKKKKRPPGYYSYLKDGSDEVISPAALVNGHTSSAVTNSVGVEDAEFMVDMLPSVMPRTCDSPQNPMDFISDPVPDSPFPRTLVANGKILESLGEDTAANGVELHTEESPDLDPEKHESQSPPADSALSASGAIPISQPAKSWASLFHDSKPSSSSPMAYVETKCSPPVPSPLTSEKQVEVKEGLVPVSEDPVAIKIAELLETVTLIHKPVSLQPRGLINKGNWCYINAVSFLDAIPRPGYHALGDKIVRDIRPGAAFEPTYIYRLLTVIKSSLSEKGRQEDAEEYLGFILNGLHEEMLSLKKLLSPTHEKLTVSNGPRSHLIEDEEQEDTGEGSEDEWEQVGPRNKSSVTRQADFVQTPITGIFGGHIRSVVYQQSSKESATLQPFFTLQLDIQSDKIRTVQDALESLVARESVQGYTTKTKQEVEVSRRVTLEKLPPVLVLHLKRFVYEKTGGCQKLVKNIDYPVDLEISKVVYHHGNSATGGHYTTDVFQIGLNGWLRIDDQTVKVINQYQVVKPTADRTAYLLYYRRVDLL